MSHSSEGSSPTSSSSPSPSSSRSSSFLPSESDLRSGVSSTRQHLAAKFAEAESFLTSSKTSAEAALLPVARSTILAAQWAVRMSEGAFEGIKRHPELVGGTFLR